MATNGFDKRPQDINRLGNKNGTKHMTTKLKEAITKISEETGTAEDVEILKTLVNKAKDGDMNAMKLIFNYMDGMPMQGLELGNMNGTPFTVVTKIPDHEY